MVSLHMMKDYVLLPCSNGVETAKNIASHLEKISLGEIEKFEKIKKQNKLNLHDELRYDYLKLTRESKVLLGQSVKRFYDGEILPTVPESVRGQDVYIVQNTFNPNSPLSTSDNLMELFLTIDAVKRSSPGCVNLILPYLSYSKQERRQGRQPISEKIIIDFFATAGVDRLIVMDLHAPASEGFSSAKDMLIEPLYASPVFKTYLEQTDFKGVVVAPDAGAAKTVKHYSNSMNLPLALGYKIRSANSMHNSETQGVLGELKGLDAVLIDDQISTGGTLCNAAYALKEKGAKTVQVLATTGLFVGKAEENLRNAYENNIIDKVVVTNTLTYSKDFLARNSHIEVLDAMPMFAKAIYALQTNGSLSELYDPKLRLSMFGEQKI